MGNANAKSGKRKGEAKQPEESKTQGGRRRSVVADRSEREKVTKDDFIMMNTVGKGSFGKVIQVRHKGTGKIYAMKVLNKTAVISRKQYHHTLTERKILEEVDHPFLVSLRFAFQTSSKLFMVFDFFNGGELYHYISRGPFTEERARFYAAEIILGLDHLHSADIIYRDLKPENLLLDADGHIRITDFGLSKEEVTDQNVTSICGTPEYLAPEIIRRQAYGKPVDWWSLGTLLYEMIGGLPPFYDKNRQRMYRKILEAELVKPSSMSEEAFDCCQKLLIRDPTRRLGFNGGDEIKAHPFFAPIDWDALLRKEMEPPFKPQVSGVEDVGNVDKTFLSEKAAVSQTLQGAEIVGKDDFDQFTYTHDCVIDGQTYSVSDDTERFLRDGAK